MAIRLIQPSNAWPPGHVSNHERTDEQGSGEVLRVIIEMRYLIIILILLFFAPYVFISLMVEGNKVADYSQLPTADAAIVFGAHVTESREPTEILKERLDAGIRLYEEGKADVLVVSNTELASGVMREYFIENGVKNADIEIDTEADLTSDTCIYEAENAPDRTRIFLSQGFHLNRLIYLCRQLGVDGVGFPVERISLIDREATPSLLKWKIRTQRFLREALLSWPVLLGVYH